MENADYTNVPNNRQYSESVEVRDNKKNNLLPILIWLWVLWLVWAAVVNMNKNPNAPKNWIIQNIQNTVAQVVPGKSVKYGSFDEFYKGQLSPLNTYLANAQKVSSFEKTSGTSNFNLKFNAASWNSFWIPQLSLNLDGKILAKMIVSQKYLDWVVSLKWNASMIDPTTWTEVDWELKNLDLWARIVNNKLYLNFGSLEVASKAFSQAQMVQTMYWSFLSGQWVEIPMSGQDAASLSNSFDTTTSTKFIASLISWANNYPLLNGQKIADWDYTTYAVSLNKQNFPAMIQAVANDPATKKSIGFPWNDAEYASGVAKTISDVNEMLKNVNLSWTLALKDSNDYKMTINSLTFSWNTSISWDIVKKWNESTSNLIISDLTGGVMKQVAKIETKTSEKTTNFVITNLETNKIFVKWDVSYDVSFNNDGSSSNIKLNFSDEAWKVNWSFSADQVSKKDDSIVAWTVPTNVKTIEQLMQSFGMSPSDAVAVPGTN